MLEWLAAAASSVVLGSSSPGILQRFRDKVPNRPPPKERTIASADVACVAAAVAAREAALQTGIQANGASISSAYSARASALSSAYAQSERTAVKKGVQDSWKNFNTAMRAAKKNWQAARDVAWKQFRTAIKNCKGGEDLTDTSNAVDEPKGE